MPTGGESRRTAYLLGRRTVVRVPWFAVCLLSSLKGDAQIGTYCRSYAEQIGDGESGSVNCSAYACSVNIEKVGKVGDGQPSQGQRPFDAPCHTLPVFYRHGVPFPCFKAVFAPNRPQMRNCSKNAAEWQIRQFLGLVAVSSHGRSYHKGAEPSTRLCRSRYVTSRSAERGAISARFAHSGRAVKRHSLRMLTRCKKVLQIVTESVTIRSVKGHRDSARVETEAQE